eukprot:474149_1
MTQIRINKIMIATVCASIVMGKSTFPDPASVLASDSMIVDVVSKNAVDFACVVVVGCAVLVACSVVCWVVVVGCLVVDCVVVVVGYLVVVGCMVVVVGCFVV